MPSLLIRLNVADHAAWELAFDDQGDARRANGSLGSRLFRNTADPNEILALLEWDDLERARLFVQSDEMREAMVQGSVVEQPQLWFLEETDCNAV